MNDVAVLRGRLAGVEAEAREQPWADQRPWRAETHVAWDGELPVVDLHGLKAGLARRAVRATVGAVGELEAGAVCFVTGRGRHSVGPGGVLGAVVRKELQRAGADQPTWSARPHGAARWVWIHDPERAPAAATGALGWGFVVLMVGFAIAAVVAVANQLM